MLYGIKAEDGVAVLIEPAGKNKVSNKTVVTNKKDDEGISPNTYIPLANSAHPSASVKS